ncbi:23S rRNA (guanosine(2251)-2'-O)-methyltransferase RlmB [Candidatus Viridilinea mediisalina]|uniref:23S rRNA (Guanosine(2251)-2'-O)-methyltransferase RlmB n=1 Tax=Candidatus Viridilinea mediisalina TaxID=2024553 RepID=A0A2A6RGL3_9CHLR|nr:23S rRNA (guanosine(2251)-2'-O)-methyltransferase RlmB [Candidatus Viridilinea mediisalina]PDW02207.1 23S rRNA (guanosine(2251)-2'-O)-methyltransferase RlmB [Candidatus Viridilinea mediisalina]
MNELLYGRNAVREALRARRRKLQRLTISSGVQETGVMAEIVRLAEAAEVAVQRVERQALDRQLREANHQGVMLETDGYPYVDLEECLVFAAERKEPPLLLLLDHLQDPQNVGTLLRTAEVVGAHGVAMPGRRAAEITPAVVNASSGATEHLRVALVGNLAQTIVMLQKEGVWVVGLEDDPEAQPFDNADLNMPLALVVGAEGAGLARLIRERCDFLVRLPMMGQIASLNAAVAGSIALYGAWRQRFAA